MAIRNVRKIGDPVLNKVCKEVREVNDRIRELIDDMFDTMYEADGVGLAAPQVGILKRIVVIDVTGEDPILLINHRWRTDRIRRMLKCSGQDRCGDPSEPCEGEGLQCGYGGVYLRG